jgi:hypothetical protein
MSRPLRIEFPGAVCAVMKERLERDRALEKRIRGITEELMGRNGQQAT